MSGGNGADDGDEEADILQVPGHLIDAIHQALQQQEDEGSNDK